MFRELAPQLGSPATVFAHEPSELAAYLEAFWALTLGPGRRFNAVRRSLLEPGTRIIPLAPSMAGYHLIYAFLIESTGICEIFTRVLDEALNGERLGILSEEAQHWIRNTEDLFYKPPPFGSVYGVESRLRPDVRASRRNAYYRVFGAELANVQESVNFVRPQASNGEFISTLEAFLHEVWVGIVNESNASGANPTDDAAIEQHAQHLREMLSARHLNHTLSREEFFAVATMSWFHLTVEFDSAIVTDLRARDTSEARRLSRIGERVNLRPHDHADSYFRLADPLTVLLAEIERTPAPLGARQLYPSGAPLRNNVETIIALWSIATGRDLKVRPSQDFRRIAAHAGQRLQALPAPVS